MTDKKELAEQILKKHFGHAYGALHPIMHIAPMTAAIIEAMSINSENVYTKNPCDENVNMSDTTDDAQSNVADNQKAIEPKGEWPCRSGGSLMKIEIYRNGEYFSTHHVAHTTRRFSQEACEARRVIIEQEVVVLRNNLKRVTGSDMDFTFVLVAQSILSNAAEMQAWRERKQRQGVTV